MSEYRSRVIKYISKNGIRYRVDYAYIAPDGVYHKSCKRGFSLKREADTWIKHELPKLVAEKEQDKLSSSVMTNPQNQAIEDMLFDKLVEMYMKRSEIRRKETTYETKESIITSKILPYFKDKKVFNITVEDVENWQDIILKLSSKTGKPYSQTYIRTIRSQFTAIMNYAVRLGLPFNPLDRSEMIGSKDSSERMFWTLDQYKQFRNVIAEKPEYFYAFEVLFWCGLRMGEMLALKLNDIDFENQTLKVDETYSVVKGKTLLTSPKTKESNRIIHIPKTLADELKEYVDAIYGLEDDDRIFHITKSGLHKELDRGVKLCKIPDVCVHSLRHSCSSFLQSEIIKAPEVIVSSILGHSKKKTMTGRYSHAYEDDLIEIAKRINDVMEEL